MIQQPERRIIARLSTDLLQARKDGDVQKKEILQSVLARITNAEAIPIRDVADEQRVGVGSTEAVRRILSEGEMQDVVQEEIGELEESIAAMASQPDHLYVHDLKAKVAILSQYL